jgi:hypothetical protein
MHKEFLCRRLMELSNLDESSDETIMLKMHNRETAMEITLSQGNVQRWLAMLMALNLLVLLTN